MKGGIDMSDENYQKAVVCENCDFKGEANIPKGTPMQEAICPKCGNRTLREALPGEVD
jgi:predicted nucleic-acid-binding Zn-ribbon protein